jgi:hypothetical protein
MIARRLMAVVEETTEPIKSIVIEHLARSTK